jgi:hypothetical protein
MPGTILLLLGERLGSEEDSKYFIGIKSIYEGRENNRILKV